MPIGARRFGSGSGLDFLNSENYWIIMLLLFVGVLVVPLIVYYIKRPNYWDS